MLSYVLEIFLRPDVSLFRGFSIPEYRQADILFDPGAIIIGATKIKLR